MKILWNALRLMLPVAAIVLLALHMAGKGGDSKTLLMSGLFCSMAGMWLNLWLQRRERKEKEGQEDK
ncbi:MAG: hypothetical protein IJE07_10285 [Clostridia bacterium]|nr:hypothetical protein [Clostridia bacterium]